MKKILFLLLLVTNLTLTNTYGQNYQGHFVVSKSSSTTKLQEYRDEALGRDLTNYTKRDSTMYFNYLSSINYALGVDSAEYYFSKAAQLDMEWLCFFTRMNVKRDIPDANFLIGRVPKDAYFAYHFSQVYLNSFFAKCDKCYDGGRVNPDKKEKITLNVLDSLFLQSHDDDQQYRKEIKVNREKQGELDRLNRIFLDSFYEDYGFPSKKLVNKESQETAWLILQHSTDCEWTEKWILRFLDAYQAGDYSGRLLAQTIKRFYQLETGYCVEKAPTASQLFIKKLKQKYPESYGQRFGYGAY